MMRPMKLGGDQILFGQGCLEHLSTLPEKKAVIVTGPIFMEQAGILPRVRKILESSGVEVRVYDDVESDPSFSTIYNGAKKMSEFEPDLIIALGGGSAMDAAKGMWIYYENPGLSSLEEILPPNKIPPLRNKARLVCIPSTAGTASEVSRSIVITDDETHIKYGIGDMEMMPDIAICDPLVTASMPASITAETGLDALTHSLEALASNRSNYVSDILAKQAVHDIFEYLPKAYEDGANLEYREKMLNASMIAGMAFTNVSLGIVHSMSHTLGSYFGMPHGLANAILLPYVLKFNSQNDTADQTYSSLAQELGDGSLIELVSKLNENLGVPASLSKFINDKEKYESLLDEMSEMALKDGCTKTNPIIPTIEQLKSLFVEAY